MTRRTAMPMAQAAAPATGDRLKTLLGEAARIGASHLHLVPFADGLIILLRISGVLREHVRLDQRHGAALVESMAAQPGGSGRIVLPVPRSEEPGDVPWVPGMPAPIVGALRTALGGRGGLVLLAGTPGSGRTTTLRKAIEGVEAPARSVLSLTIGDEDPAARTLAHDPDVVALDGIAPCTAAAAIEAARGGRLVLATIAAPDAIAAIEALRAMRIAPFPLASALHLIVAQRLATRLCPACRAPVQGENRITALLGFEPGTIVHRASGCGSCRGTGEAGRIGVFEAIEAKDPIRLLIDSGADAAVIASHAFRDAPNIASAARSLALAGTISAEEAIRLSRPPSTG